MRPPKTKAAPPWTENAASNSLQTKCTKTTKTRTTLSYLMRGPRHRFHAERWGDHALHSTVSSLEHEFGIGIERVWTEVPNSFGSRTRVKLYSVSDTSRELAVRVLAGTCGRNRKGGST